MRWETLEDALAVLETEREYDGYFCSIQDAVVIVIPGSLYDLQSVKKSTSGQRANMSEHF